MNAERLKIARRLVACKGWVPVFGMRASVCGGWAHATPLVWDGFAWADSDHDAIYSECDVVIDLDDDLTRLGVLAVVRRAWGIPHAGVWGNPSLAPGIRFSCGEANGRPFGSGPTEEAALLAALEAVLR